MGISYKPSDEVKSVFGDFEFELAGNVYTKDKLTNEIFTALSNLKPTDSKSLEMLVIALVGKEEYMKIKPINPIEVMLLAEWIANTLCAPISTKKIDLEAEEKNA
jgi:hypothetical protein